MGLIDFGISAFYINPKTKKLIPNESGCFYGTTQFASINAHLNNQQTPRDDLMSWFYMLCSLSMGKLPWSKLKDKDEVLEAKISVGINELCQNLPSTAIEIYKYLSDLKYDDTPDYDKKINKLILKGKEDENINWIGTEWKDLSDLDPESSSIVPSVIGDEKFDLFDPINPQKWYMSSKGECWFIT